MKRIAQVQTSWRGTPYHTSSRAKGPTGGVDCVRLGAGMADDLFGYRRELPPNLALDVAIHDRPASEAQLRLLLRTYPELDAVPINEDGSVTIEPMDMVVCGPSSGGVGHLMIGGYRPNTLWEADRPFVREIGIGLAIVQRGYVVKHVYRFTNRMCWLS